MAVLHNSKVTRRHKVKGVVLAKPKAAESVINAFKSVNANILVQEFIKEANGKTSVVL
jgi:glutathione synthase/RimK-type ligase-like ATP-grasp enzyme